MEEMLAHSEFGMSRLTHSSHEGENIPYQRQVRVKSFKEWELCKPRKARHAVGSRLYLRNHVASRFNGRNMALRDRNGTTPG